MRLRVHSLTGLAVALNLLHGCAGTGETTHEDPAGNLAVITQLSEKIAVRALAGLPMSESTTALLTVAPRDQWFLFDAFARALDSLHYRVATVPPTGVTVEVVATRVSTRYDHSRRTWLLGSRLVDRTVEVELRCRIDTAGAVLGISTLRESARDTVLAADVPSLETPDLPATRAQVPPGGVVDDLVEPLIIAGATAVAVILLFTVRS